MGLNYSFEIVTPLAGAGRLIERLAGHLVPADAERVLAARADPASFASLAGKESYETSEVCLAMLFRSDVELAEYGGVERLSDPATGRVAVGCVWTSLRCGDRFALLRCTAATSAMSRLFAASANVNDTFAGIGRDCGALLVALDDEQGRPIGVWPARVRLGEEIGDEETWESAGGPLIDRYCAELLTGFGVRPTVGRGRLE